MWHILKRKLWIQRSELKMMLVMSGISLMMIFAFGGFGGTYRPQVLVADMDQSALSEKFIQALDSDKTHSYQVTDSTEGQQQVRENKALALLTIEKGFEAELQNGQAPKMNLMSVKSDADIMVLRPLILNRYTQMRDWHRDSETIAKRAADKGGSFDAVYEETYAKLQRSAQTKTALSLNVSTTDGEAAKNAILMHSLIGFLIFFVAYSCVFGATDILVERKQNTWQRLLISPSSKLGMLTGNLLVSWIMGLIQLGLVLFVGGTLFKIDFGGNLLAMFAAGMLFCLAMSGFGIFLSALAKSMQQIAALTSVALTAFGMLGGCLWPLDLVSNPILIGLSKVIPHTYAVRAMTAISQGDSLLSTVPNLLVLAAMAAVFLGVGFVRLMTLEEQYQ